MERVRIDKWLWAVRVYKTRGDAADACRGSAVRLNKGIAKPSATVRIGDIVVARTKALTRSLRVSNLSDKRMAAALLPQFFEDITAPADFEVAREKRANAKIFSHQAKGRPTKKNRRDIERLIDPNI